MAKNNNLNEFLTDIANAIRTKKGTKDPINAQNFASEISTIEGGSSSSNSKWTGHADAEGLRAIGWTDEDIAYYQENGVNWNEEDDEYHKVPDDNKALYGVLTASNISSYKNIIVYLPKIDTSGISSMRKMFSNFSALISIPMLDTSRVKNMSEMFDDCHALTSIPQLNTRGATNMSEMFNKCHSLLSIPMLDTSSVTDMSSMFAECYSLLSIPMLDTSNVTKANGMFSNCFNLTYIPQLDTSNVTNMNYMFNGCYKLTTIPQLDTSSATSVGNIVYGCSSLIRANLKNIKLAYELISSALLIKDSLLYIINNEAAESAIIIKLASYAYDKWANDPDVVAALANHPNISLAK